MIATPAPGPPMSLKKFAARVMPRSRSRYDTSPGASSSSPVMIAVNAGLSPNTLALSTKMSYTLRAPHRSSKLNSDSNRSMSASVRSGYLPEASIRSSQRISAHFFIRSGGVMVYALTGLEAAVRECRPRSDLLRHHRLSDGMRTSQIGPSASPTFLWVRGYAYLFNTVKFCPAEEPVSSELVAPAKRLAPPLHRGK
ncbi:hypothetical protein ACQ3JU_0380 (plasmid) [Bradyrhizobium guangxiense]